MPKRTTTFPGSHKAVGLNYGNEDVMAKQLRCGLSTGHKYKMVKFVINRHGNPTAAFTCANCGMAYAMDARHLSEVEALAYLKGGGDPRWVAPKMKNRGDKPRIRIYA